MINKMALKKAGGLICFKYVQVIIKVEIAYSDLAADDLTGASPSVFFGNKID